MRSHRAGTGLSVLLAAVSILFSAPLRAQNTFPVKERMACPTTLVNMYIVGTSERTGATYTFVTNWVKTSSEGLAQAFYDPGVGLRYFESTDQRARWLYPGLYVACWKLVTYRENGSIANSVPIYDILYTEGEVREYDCSGAASVDPPVLGPYEVTEPDYSYDGPEDPECDDDGGGDGSGGGGPGAGFEYICVDVWVPGEGWQEVWCGYAPVTA